MELINELRNTTNKINSFLKEIKLELDVIEKEYDPKLEFEYDNKYTSTRIYVVDRNMKSGVFYTENMKRIICLKGKLIITDIETQERIVIEKTETHLILSDSKFVIEAIENSEYACVDMHGEVEEKSKIAKVNSIYNK